MSFISQQEKWRVNNMACPVGSAASDNNFACQFLCAY